MNLEETMLIIPENVVREIGQYLSSRPWIEVQHIMPALQSLQVVSVSGSAASEELDDTETEELA